MRWILTGDEFDADEADRVGLVQEVTADAAAAHDAGQGDRADDRGPRRAAGCQDATRRRRTWPAPRETTPQSSGCGRR